MRPTWSSIETGHRLPGARKERGAMQSTLVRQASRARNRSRTPLGGRRGGPQTPRLRAQNEAGSLRQPPRVEACGITEILNQGNLGL